jgi:phage/plasmid-associated DNA primase
LQHLLCTNELPKIESSWTTALERRIHIVHFLKRYFAIHEEGYDESNPLHGRADSMLGDRLAEPHHLTELLVWLVRGTVAYYAAGQELLEMPQRCVEVRNEYRAETDPMQDFLNSECAFDEKAFTGSTDLLARFNDPTRIVNGSIIGDHRAREIKLTYQKLKSELLAKGGKISFDEHGGQNRNLKGYWGIRLLA